MSLTEATVKSEAAREFGWDRTTGSWTAAQSADFALFYARGLDQFYHPPVLEGERRAHRWSFLYPQAEIQLTAAYTTGTVVVVAGVVTLTGGTWPTWAEQGDLWLEDNNDVLRRYTINTRDSNTQITLDDTSVGIAAGATYTLRRHYYDLPTDFEGMESDGFIYRRDQTSKPSYVELVSDAMIRRWDNASNEAGTPTCAAIIPIPATNSAGNLWKVEFWPHADATGFLEYRYHSIGAAGTYIPGGSEHQRTIIASVMDMGWQQIHNSYEKHAFFLECLRQSVLHDRRNYSIHNLGPSVGSYAGLSTMEALRTHRSLSVGPFTLNGASL